MPEFFRGYGEVLGNGGSRVTIAFAVAVGAVAALMLVYTVGGLVRWVYRVLARRKSAGDRRPGNAGPRPLH